MIQRPSIAVLIACHNRRAKTLAALAGLAAQDATATLHPVIYDDGSTDGTAEAIRLHSPGADMLPGSGDAYWAGGMRAAFSHALASGYDFYLWLNDDVILAPDAIARLLDVHGSLAADGRPVCLIGGAVLDAESGQPSYGGIAVRTGWNPLQFDRVRPASDRPQACDTLNGNVVLIPHATALQIGSIRVGFLHTLGDLDYGLRVKQAGGWVGLAPGYVGTCATNAVVNRWLNPDLPLRSRWRLVGTPLGLPLGPWLHFARVHGGPFWFVLAPLVYWRLFTPTVVVRTIVRWRVRRGAVGGGCHAAAS